MRCEPADQIAATGSAQTICATGPVSDRERQMVHLLEAGYSRAEIVEMMGYANALTVTTTWNRVKAKILEHVGGEDELLDLGGRDVLAIHLPSEVVPQ
jgi:hypothetical protein